MQLEHWQREFASQETEVETSSVADDHIAENEVNANRDDAELPPGTGTQSDSEGTVGPRFSVKDIVDVMPRLWAGINKPGGAARITKVNYDAEEDEYTYNVSYIVHSGGETHVEQIYINLRNEVEPAERQRHIRGRCRYYLTMQHYTLRAAHV